MENGKDKNELEVDIDNDNTIIEWIEKDKRTKPLPWYYAPSYLFIWVALFFAVVFPLFNYLPTAIKIEEEASKPGQFVAERAQQILLELDRMGPKIVGDEMNEKTMVEFLLNKIELVRQVMRTDIYELEVDVQRASGAYLHWEMINMYQAVQNVIVKLSTRSSNSTSYLLINSHYDSKPGSVGTGDAGFMVVTMLEVMRLLATSEETFEHPVVFLFNGAEEQPLQGSHAFISQHKWSPNCKALINLDSCGAGGREILFQGGPNHPWLMRHYREGAKHPFATTMAEEVFQAGIIPSDTDFRIFRDFGPVPGLDMAGVYNGFVYHTKYDRFDVISRASLQNTGENLLSLVRSICNAEEMHDTEAHSAGHSVFFDFLGLFFVYYLESTGIALNICFAFAGLILVCVSLWRMTKTTDLSIGFVAGEFGIFFLLELAGFILALGLPLLMSVFYDAGDRTMTYLTNSWLVIGLFICPSLIGLVLPFTLYYTLRPREKIPHPYHLQMAGHAHCVLLALLCIIITAVSIRSAYLCMISLLFYVGALIINLVSKLHDRGYYWSILMAVCQAMPFLYFSYLFHSFLVIVIPMTARKGTEVNPDMLIALLCAMGTIFAFGFVAPLINIFRRPNCMIGGLALIMFIFCMISVSEVGFPYRAKTNVMRVNFLQVHRRFYEYDGSLSLDDSGYYFDLQDRRLELPLRDTMDFNELISLENVCDTQMMCGVPCFNHRWCEARKAARWLPRKETVEVPGITTLELLNKTVLEGGYTVRYEFKLTGPARMSVFLKPMDGVKMLDWSFLRGMLDNPGIYKPPYHIFFAWGVDDSPIEFYLELAKTNGKFDEPVFEIGISGHYLSNLHKRDAVSTQFIDDLPDFVHAMEWPASYDRYIY
ncbi:endoplasmic reticulum metallopeptidase 1-like [Drosophila sulfurigaster albostrigata]|uniref:endoplasmic reticulum metallopeptidase 1-like n=1 Tax=Drosophila sulfurigaster albostrigata TaxID=89887 RepID=UPI002D21ADC6|nr:endoplasmic reticulum metallopeptidase 1-like [Drosophila sulfurigaster albostrigata]